MASKTQRRVNRVIRFYNHEFATDPYLEYRFHIDQVQTQKEDRIEYFRFTITDTKTDDVRNSSWYAGFEFSGRMGLPFKLFNFFNDFIIKKLHNVKRG